MVFNATFNGVSVISRRILGNLPVLPETNATIVKVFRMTLKYLVCPGQYSSISILVRIGGVVVERPS